MQWLLIVDTALIVLMWVAMIIVIVGAFRKFRGFMRKGVKTPNANTQEILQRVLQQYTGPRSL